MKLLTIALLSMLFGNLAQAGGYEVPYGFELSERSDGVPLLQYDKKKDGGILSFRLKPKFRSPLAIPAPLAKPVEVWFNPHTKMIRDMRCGDMGEYELFCEIDLTKLGEKIIITAGLNRGVLAFVVNLIIEPKAGILPELPAGSEFTASATVMHSYFKDHPIPMR